MPKNSKQDQLKKYLNKPETDHLTTNHGVKIPDNQNSLTVGERGPTLMEDFMFREKMTHFDHERIPERIVHARGFGAHGIFTLYESLSDLTCAKFLNDTSTETPVFVRFSTVAGNKGSAETVRDARGFSVKFYTSEGNFDLVGNNIPVFFIQDAMKFPDLVHAVKPEPHNNIPQASAAHDTFWDFISLMPESMAMVMWVLSDRALPRSVRMMEGFGVHTFRLLTAEGKSHFIKWHWKPKLGLASLIWEESQTIQGMDPDFLNRDLHNAIESGDFPEWELGLQVFTEEQAADFDFDVLDATKLVPEELVPVRRIGKMTLNRNVDNFFAETEQAAFHPGHLVPGIDFSNDPLLQGRLFSYTDTQLIRLGGPNFHELPINRPIVPIRNNQRDGYGRQNIDPGRVAYEPNSLAKGCPFAAGRDMGAFVHYLEKLEGHKVRARSESFRNYFGQARLFWNSQTAVEKQHIVDAAGFELGKCKTLHVRERVTNLLWHVSEELAQKVAQKLGLENIKGDISYLEASTAPLPLDREQRHDQTSEALSVLKNAPKVLAANKVALLVADGADLKSVSALKDSLMKKGAKVSLVGPRVGPMKSGGQEVELDESLDTTSAALFDGVILGDGDSAKLKTFVKTAKADKFLRETYVFYKTLGAQGAAAGAFQDLPFDGPGVVLEKESGKFADKFIEALKTYRHWERDGLS